MENTEQDNPLTGILNTPWKKYSLLAGAVLAAVIITIPKLYTMSQIRGWLPGAKSIEGVVLEKWYQPALSRKRSDTWWIRISEGDIQTPGDHRLNLQAESWQQLETGDTIELVLVDDEYYVRGGIYSSNGNFILDIVILFAELGLIIYILTYNRLRPVELNVDQENE